MTTSQLVIGLGEVGHALVKVLDAPGRDIEPTEIQQADVLHIAIPWFDGFVDAVRIYQLEYSSSLVIVHSTVPVGTCDPEGWVHSPVRGRHPFLADGLRNFIKPFGGERAEEAARLWPGETFITEKAANTEAGKLWELAQFGIQVRITQAIYEWCEEKGLDADVVYRKMAATYNWGYSDLGESQFVRPILDYVPGKIGGHCITENSRFIDHSLIDIIYQDKDEEA